MSFVTGGYGYNNSILKFNGPFRIFTSDNSENNIIANENYIIVSNKYGETTIQNSFQTKNDIIDSDN